MRSLTDEQVHVIADEIGMYSVYYGDDPKHFCNKFARAIEAAAQPVAPIVPEPERMTVDESKEYLVKFMEQHFTDKTFHRYIRGQRNAINLAGDFAWQMARALRMLSIAPQPAEQPQQESVSLPPLPAKYHVLLPQRTPVYTADQMHEYARATLAAAPQADAWNYQELFNAIAAATKIEAGSIAISVDAFRAAMQQEGSGNG